MFRKGKIWDSNVWNKAKFRIPMFGKAKIQNSNEWKKVIFRIPIFGKSQNLKLWLFQTLEV